MDNYYVNQRVRLALLPSQLGTITKIIPQIYVKWDGTDVEVITSPADIKPINE